MKTRGIPNALVGIAGVHYVAFEQSRRGMVALPTTRNTAGYDILAVSRDGKKRANIQVKAAQRKPTFFPMPSSSKICRGPDDFYVLVRGIAPGQETECFLVEGREARSEVGKVEQDQRKYGQRSFPCIYIHGKHSRQGAAEHWKGAWERWKL